MTWHMTSKSSSQTQMVDIVKAITILGQSILAERMMIEQSYIEVVLSSSFVTCVTCHHQLLNGLQKHLAYLMNLMAKNIHTILTTCSRQTRVSYAQCKCPSKWSSNDVKQTYRKNIAKWDAAMKFCKAHQNMQFKIVTEKFFTT